MLLIDFSGMGLEKMAHEPRGVVDMGLFERLFNSSSDGQTTRVRQSNEDRDRITGDRYTHTGGGGHVHESFNLNTSTGEYSQYGGGENSSDRSGNK